VAQADGARGCSELLVTPLRHFRQDLLIELHHQTAENHQPLSNAQFHEFLFDNLGAPHMGPVRIQDVYCNEVYDIPSNYRSIQDTINIEHSWPQSHFSGRYARATQKADLHHLFIANAHVNSSRSSHDFGVVVHRTATLDCGDSKLGYDQSGKMVFEPPNAHKGALARAMFYFAVRYEMPLSSRQEFVLRKWNRDFPVTEAEKRRNDRIERLQGNRNPFVDDSSLVNQIERFN
jgi:hypothetical protein